MGVFWWSADIAGAATWPEEGGDTTCGRPFGTEAVDATPTSCLDDGQSDRLYLELLHPSLSPKPFWIGFPSVARTVESDALDSVDDADDTEVVDFVL